jgi:hypothetical protein
MKWRKPSYVRTLHVSIVIAVIDAVQYAWQCAEIVD